MAAGDTSRIKEASLCGLRMELWKITSNGATAITLSSNLHTVLAAFSSWGEDIDTTGHVLECTVSGSTVTVTCSGAITKDAYIMILGY